MLAGDGGDELFAGNKWYRRMQTFEAYHALPLALRRFVIEPLVFGIPGADRLVPVRRARRYISRAEVPMPDRAYPEAMEIVAAASEIMSPELIAGVDVDEPLKILRETYERTRSSSQVQ
jgi:asparagine synthase (glutamine-hydrolysing)